MTRFSTEHNEAVGLYRQTLISEKRRVRNSQQGAPPSLLPAGVHWRFRLRAFRCNRGRSAWGVNSLLVNNKF